MNPEETLAAFARRGIDLWEEGGNLRYRCPEGVLLDADRELLTLRKPELLPHLATFRYAPLSRLQEGVWWAHRFQPATGGQNMADVLRLRGSLDQTALEGALGDVVRRHAILRTTFPEIGGEPVQKIHASARLNLAYSAVSESDLPEAVFNASYAPFELAHQFPLRATLFRRQEREHILSLVSHAMAIDGWSFGLFRSELFAAYTARASGTPAALPPIEAQYADFAFWQRRRGDEDTMRTLLSDWRAELEGAELALPWPEQADRGGGCGPGGPPHQAGAEVSFRLPAEDYSRLKEAAAAQSFTVSAVLLAAFCAMLRRATGRRDLVVAAPVFERPRTEFEPLIGLFRNAILLRLDFSGHTSFRETVRHASGIVRRAQQRLDAPYEKVIAQLPAAEPASAWFNFRNYSSATAPVPAGVAIEPYQAAIPEPPGDLELIATPDSEGLLLALSYRPNRVSQACVQGMVESLIRILRQVPVEFDAPLSEGAGYSAGRPRKNAARALGPAPCTAGNMIRIWEDVMDLDGLTAEDDFVALGGTSLNVWQILARVKASFGISVGPGTLLTNPSIGAFAAEVGRSAGRPEMSCMVPIQSAGSRPPLFWLNPHFAVNGVAERLGRDLPFLGLYYPAREFTAPYRMETLAAPLAEQIRRVQEEGPYHLAGWCLSGVVAFEVARQLRAQGQEVAFVALFDSFNPACRPSRFRTLPERVRFHLSTLGRLTLRERRSYLRERAARMWRRALPALQSKRLVAEPPHDVRQAVDLAGRQYEPQTYPGRVLLFVPQRRLMPEYPDTQGWDKVAPNLELHVVPGDHVDMFLAPNVDVLASKLRASFGGLLDPAFGEAGPVA